MKGSTWSRPSSMRVRNMLMRRGPTTWVMGYSRGSPSAPMVVTKYASPSRRKALLPGA